MTDIAPQPPIRERLKDLNTKAYYLLVALSFVYRTSSRSSSLKWAFVLTAFVAVLPVQDYVKSVRTLKCLQFAKVILLWAAFVFTIIWIWTAAPTTN
jgi:hypothetical protein